MNVKQIISVAKMFVVTSRTCVANLHDKGKSNMAAIVDLVVFVYAWLCSNMADSNGCHAK